MEITHETMQKQLDSVKANTEGFLQGYAQALSWVDTQQNAKTAEAPVEQPAS